MTSERHTGWVRTELTHADEGNYGDGTDTREVEEFLYTHPAVDDVQVIGVPDERYGEEVMAWVRLRPGAEATEEEVREFCQGSIAHFKVPRHVHFVSDSR